MTNGRQPRGRGSQQRRQTRAQAGGREQGAEPTLNAFEKFGSQYTDLERVRDYSERLGKNSADEEVLNYAVLYARENITGLRDLLNDSQSVEEIKDKPRLINSFLATAGREYNSRLAYNYENKRDEIIRMADEGALARKFYEFRPVKISGKGSVEHNKSAEIHETYHFLSNLLEAIKAEKLDQKEILPYIQKFLKRSIVDEGYKDDPILKDDEQFKILALNAAFQTVLTIRGAPLHIASSLIGDSRKELDDRLPEVSDKANYARNILRELAKDEKNANEVISYLGGTFKEYTKAT